MWSLGTGGVSPSTFTVSQCKFVGGDSGGGGGNLYLQKNLFGFIDIDSSTFLDGGPMGGNLNIRGKSAAINITNSKFERGFCPGIFSPSYSGGITISTASWRSTVEISGCTFRDNRSDSAPAVSIRAVVKLTLSGNDGTNNTNTNQTRCDGISNRVGCLKVWEEFTP